MIETKKQPEQTMDKAEVRRDQIAEDVSDESRNAANEVDFSPLFKDHEAEKFRADWLKIQSYFIDNPSDSIRAADELVASVIENITTTFASNRTSLENQWKRGDKASTEQLRIVLKRYRSLFNRLLSLEP